MDTLLVPVELQLSVGVVELVPVLWLKLFVTDVDRDPAVTETVKLGWKEQVAVGVQLSLPVGEYVLVKVMVTGSDGNVGVKLKLRVQVMDGVAVGLILAVGLWERLDDGVESVGLWVHVRVRALE